MYRRARMWDDALRVASDYVPAKKHEIALEARAAGASGGDAKAKGEILRRGGPPCSRGHARSRRTGITPARWTPTWNSPRR